MTRSLAFYRSLQAWHLYLVGMLLWGAFSFLSNSLLSLQHVFIFLSVAFLCRETKVRKIGKSECALFLFLLAAILSVVFNWSELLSPFSKILKVKYMLVAVISAYIARNYVTSLHAYKEKILALFLGSFALTVIYGLSRFSYEYLMAKSVYRPSGFFGMIMSYSYTAVWPVLLCLFLAVNTHVKLKIPKMAFWDHKVIRYLLFFLFFVTLCLTQARGALLGFVLCAPFVFLNNRKRFVLIVLMVSTLGFFSYYKVKTASNVASESNRVFQGTKSLSNLWRLSQFEVARKAFEEKPILGQGWRSLEERSPALKEKYDIAHKEFAGHAHNNFLEVLATTGLLGFMFFMLWIFAWLKESYWSNRSSWRYFYLAGIVGFLVSGMVQSSIIDSEYLFTLFAFYGMGPLFIER